MQENNFDEQFNRFNGQWDTEEPPLGHQQRFLKKLGEKEKKKIALVYKLALPIAAAVIILLSCLVDFGAASGAEPQNRVAKLSPQVQETQLYFTSVIQKELAKVEKETSPETRILVQDALAQMEVLEKDYDKLTKELMAKGENKKIIHAMITNLQTRVSFLEEVLERIENIKKIKEKYNENKAA